MPDCLTLDNKQQDAIEKNVADAAETFLMSQETTDAKV